MDIKIAQTTDYNKILEFAFDNGVEYDETNKCYINEPFFALELTSDNDLIGSASICKSKVGDYILEQLAVKEEYRHKGYATQLIKTILRRMKELNIKKIYLIAHVYEIYLKNGFEFYNNNDKDYLISDNCLNCDLYINKECIPRIMTIDL
ncbi:MAG: GNAT family N-acetyltransferase [Lachnospiraceae bacterium]|jgi:N-acetylglutamate synthase-like GNAT family acetyltransferase|nr:GNAT family N-acetyltransferase [Lachnospiraceae bacterium]